MQGYYLQLLIGIGLHTFQTQSLSFYWIILGKAYYIMYNGGASSTGVSILKNAAWSFHIRSEPEFIFDLEAFFENEWSIVPTREKVVSGIGHATHRTDPLALATFVISIPSAAIATLMLADRFEVKKKFSRLAAWFLEQKQKNPKIKIRLERSLNEELKLLDEQIRFLESALDSQRKSSNA